MTIFNKFFKNHITIPQATNLFEEVKSQTHPDIADLKRLVDFHKAPVGTKEEMQALDLKYRAMTHVPTTIEKTMTPAQLYDADCPLWCAEYSIEQLSYYFIMTFESNTGDQIIQYMDNSVVPYIDLQKKLLKITVSVVSSETFTELVDMRLRLCHIEQHPV